MSVKQLSLDLGHRPAFGRDDLFVTDGNREAVGWIDRWPSWPGHVLAIYGPPSCGKTHLLHAFVALSHAHVLTDSDLSSLDPVAEASKNRVLALDRDDGLVDEQSLLHLFNAVREARGHMLIVCRDAPARWPIGLADLKSRLSSVQAVQIFPPNEETLAAVLAKLFSDRQLLITHDVIEYAILRMPRTFVASNILVESADREALAQGRRVTVPFIKNILCKLGWMSQ